MTIYLVHHSHKHGHDHIAFSTKESAEKYQYELEISENFNGEDEIVDLIAIELKYDDSLNLV